MYHKHYGYVMQALHLCIASVSFMYRKHYITKVTAPKSYLACIIHSVRRGKRTNTDSFPSGKYIHSSRGTVSFIP